MGLLSIILIGILPAMLFLFGGARIARSQLDLRTDREFFFYLLGGSVFLLLVQAAASLLSRLAGWEALDMFRYLLIPTLLSFLALLLLNLHVLRNASRQEWRNFLILATALILLMVSLLVQTLDIGLLILAGALILALVWALASRCEAAAFLLSLLVLLGLARLVFTRVDQAFEDVPAWVSMPVSYLSYFSAALAIALAAALIASALRKIQNLHQPATESSRLQFSAILQIGLALFLLACLAYTILWLSIWDQTSDGMGGVLFALESGLMGVASGAVMGMKAKSWFRSAGFFYALFVPLLMFGSFAYGWSVSYHELTEQRAARIQAALERFKERTGAYPAELDELVPRQLLWVPEQVILRGEDWCYASSGEGYLLGVYWREYFSTPLELRLLRQQGDRIVIPKACEDRLKVLKEKYDF